jgi:hypothetical protein
MHSCDLLYMQSIAGVVRLATIIAAPEGLRSPRPDEGHVLGVEVQ